MKLDVNLPSRIEVSDYHEFTHIQNILRNIIPGIKVIEIGCINDLPHGYYQGIAYLGNKKNVKVQNLIKKIKKEIKDSQVEY